MGNIQYKEEARDMQGTVKREVREREIEKKAENMYIPALQ